MTRASEPAGPAPGRPEGHPARKVVVVDDDREVREFLSQTLREAGFEVVLAANGLRLVSVLQVDRPDVILLDVMMSWIDGFELCRALKKNPQFSTIPVFFVTGRTSDADVRTGLACGAVDYFKKPIDAELLVARLRSVCDGAA